MINMKSFKPKEEINIAGSDGKVLKVIPLGGISDVTKNMYVYEYGNDILIVDCGVGFPDEDMPGVDLVIPDITYLLERKDKIRGFIISHGHEDHLGALPFIWPQLQVSIYTQRFTAGLIKSKFNEHKLPKDKVIEVSINQRLELGVFRISFYQASHSVPDTTGIVIRTPVGLIVHQSDFKIDWTPISGQVTDVATAAALGAEGVQLLLIDCLRVDKPGFNKSEKSIESTFEKASIDTKGKLLITMTSSNISRMQQALNAALKTGRKVAFAGRSFENCFQVARDLNYLNVPPNLVIALDSISSFAPSKVLILIAGSQGQMESALSRVAHNVHKQIKLKDGDAVMFSADPIPSTESAQYALIDSLTLLGVNVYYSAINSDLHVSGHAAQEELRLMVNLIKPKYILPIGGTYRHMKYFSQICQEMGYGKDKIFIIEEGDCLNVDKAMVKLGGRVDVQNVYVDGLGIGDVGQVVLRDRKLMSEEGVVVVVVPFDKHSGKIAKEPDVITRGFVFEEMAMDIIQEAKEIVKKTLNEHESKLHDWRFIRKMVGDNLDSYLYRVTERRPLIITVMSEF